MILELATLGLAMLSDGEVRKTQSRIEAVNEERKIYSIPPLTPEEVLALCLEEPPPSDEYLIGLLCRDVERQTGEDLDTEYAPVLIQLFPGGTGTGDLHSLLIVPMHTLPYMDYSQAKKEQEEWSRDLYVLSTGGRYIGTDSSFISISSRLIQYWRKKAWP